jgi:DNA-binding transcriptional MerR regulator
VTQTVLSIGELAHLTGLTAHTLRFYERAGVLHAVSRSDAGHRRYLPGDVQWLEFVLKLKVTGMPLAEIQRYAELRLQGDATLGARLQMLEIHRIRLQENMCELARCQIALDSKIGIYRELIAKATVF